MGYISNIGYSPYLICFLISSVVCFIDVLPNYLIFHVKRGLKYKLIFSLFNGFLSLFLLTILWEQMFTNWDPIVRGAIFGFSYPTIMKSKILLNDKDSPSNSISFEKIYNIMIIYCRDLVDESDRQFMTEKKQVLATKCGVDALYKHLKCAIEDDPKLARENKELEKKKLLKSIESIKNDENTDDEKAEALAKIIINRYPSDVPKLLKKK